MIFRRERPRGGDKGFCGLMSIVCEVPCVHSMGCPQYGAYRLASPVRAWAPLKDFRVA